MVIEAAPASSFEMSEPDRLFEFLIIALDTPTSFVRSTSLRKKMFRRIESQDLAGFFSPSGHSINSHSSGRLSERVYDARHNPHTSKAQ